MTASKQKRPEQPSATRRPGRPPSIGGKGIMIYLDKQSLDIATKLGNGNVSAGIRAALAKCVEGV